jgi:hypothetical protein
MASKEKTPIPMDTYREINDAWKQSREMPEADRADFRDFLKYRMGKLLEEHDAPDKQEGPLDWIVGKGLEALDYGPGLVRSAVNVPAIAVKEGLSPAWQEAKNAAIPFEGKPAASFGETAERMGIPPGPSVKVPILGGDVSARGAGSFLADMLASPQMLGDGIKGLISRVANPNTAEDLGKKIAAMKPSSRLSNAITSTGKVLSDPAAVIPEATGDAIYRSVFGAADDASLASRQGRVSDVAAKNNIFGSPRDIRDQLSNVLEKNDQKVKDSIEKAIGFLPPGEGISKSDLLKRARYNLQAQIASPTSTDSAAEALKAIDDMFTGIPDDHVFQAGMLPKIKKDAQKLASLSGAYNNTPTPAPIKPSAMAKALQENDLLGQGYADLGHTARRYIEDMLDRAQYGQGGKAFLTNRDSAAILSAQKPIQKMVSASPFGIGKSVPGALGFGAGFGLARQLNVDPTTAIGLGLLGAGATGVTGRSTVGLGLKKFGAPLGSAFRANIVEKYAPEMRDMPVWSDLKSTRDE